MVTTTHNSDNRPVPDVPTISDKCQSASVQSCNSPCNASADGETITLADVVVDGEFQALIPPPTDEDRRQLLINLERDGFRDPLVVWSQGNILLDEHNRLEIWRMVYEDKGETTPPAIRMIDLPDREAARRWIITNQLGRRNLTTMQRAELAKQLEPVIAEQAKLNQQQSQGRGKKGFPKSDNLLPTRTDEVVAKQAGIGKDTYRKAKKVMEQAGPETLEKTRSGEMSINKAYNQIVGKSAKNPQETSPDAPKMLGKGVLKAHEALNILCTIPRDDALRERGFEIIVDWIVENDTPSKGKRNKRYKPITFEMAKSVARSVAGGTKWSRSELVRVIDFRHRRRGEHFIAYFQGHPAFEYLDHGNGRVSLTINESAENLAEKCERLEEEIRVLKAGESK